MTTMSGTGNSNGEGEGSVPVGMTLVSTEDLTLLKKSLENSEKKNNSLTELYASLSARVEGGDEMATRRAQLSTVSVGHPILSPILAREKQYYCDAVAIRALLGQLPTSVVESLLGIELLKAADMCVYKAAIRIAAVQIADQNAIRSGDRSVPNWALAHKYTDIMIYEVSHGSKAEKLRKFNLLEIHQKHLTAAIQALNATSESHRRPATYSAPLKRPHPSGADRTFVPSKIKLRGYKPAENHGNHEG